MNTFLHRTASALFVASSAFVGLDLGTALLIMGVIIVGYTVMGGLKAVIYTDMVQWMVLIAGLSLVAIPMAWQGGGGWHGIHDSVGPAHLSLTNVAPVTIINWAVTIVPIWFVIYLFRPPGRSSE